jgi:hypothetical protein
MPGRLISIGTRIAVIAAVLATAGYAALAREDSGATYATYYNVHGIDLKIDNRAYYNGAPVPGSTWALKDLKPWSDRFFKFWDVKPGDYGRSIISIHAKNSSAWACLTFENLQEKENGRNEPEREEDGSGHPWSGELADGTEFFAWHDDGDTVFEPGEKPLWGTPKAATEILDGHTYAIADWKNGPALPKNGTRYVGVAWCAGNMTVNLATGHISCDGSTLGNEAQTDSFTVDVEITAVPSKDNPKYKCTGSHYGGGGHGGGYPHYDWEDEYVWYDWNEDGHGYCKPADRKKDKKRR